MKNIGENMALKYMYITNDLNVALIAQKCGVDRIWVDLETLGKEERQKNLNSVKSHHTVQDIKKIAPRLSCSEMLVRINPWNENSITEIEQVIDAGANLIMLPMWKTVEEVSAFLTAVNGRVKTTLLLETKEAEACLDEVLSMHGIDEIHVGLNDLHLSYGLAFMFELLVNGTLEAICEKIRDAGIPYGFGGVARIGEGLLPAEKILLEHYRLGSTRAILSRSFCNSEKVHNLIEIEHLFQSGMDELRAFEKYAAAAAPEIFTANHAEISKNIAYIVKTIKEKKNGS